MGYFADLALEQIIDDEEGLIKYKLGNMSDEEALEKGLAQLIDICDDMDPYTNTSFSAWKAVLEPFHKMLKGGQ